MKYQQNTLRERRVVALDWLLRAALPTRPHALRTWSMHMSAVLHADVRMVVPGVGGAYGRVGVKRLWLQLGNENTARISGKMFWSKSDSVSVSITNSDHSEQDMRRLVFVHFAKCQRQIVQIVILDESAIFAIQQFVYVDPGRRLIWKTISSIGNGCQQLERECKNKFPFGSRKTCRKFFGGIDKDCVKGGRLLHGDTMSCRIGLLPLVRVAPQTFCDLVGRIGRGICGQTMCARGGGNVFESEEARFEERPGLRCGNGRCVEEWPVDMAADEDGVDGERRQGDGKKKALKGEEDGEEEEEEEEVEEDED